MKWIGSEWDTAPRVYKEGRTVTGKSSLISEDWDEVRAHIISLLEAQEIAARQRAEHAAGALKTATAKLSLARTAQRPE